MVEIGFPQGFVWGAATASYQIEGGWDADGKGESIWDRFCRTPGNVANGASGDTSCDHYHRWPADIELLRSLNLGAYRFSISWPRILPDGVGRVNPAGLDFYDRLVDGLLAAGVTPYATLHHWDLPQALQDRGGWATRDTATAFAEYATIVAERLGDRVDNWWTINEPWVIAVVGHEWGLHAPGHTSLQEALDVSHHLLLAHGLGTTALRAAGVERIGIVLHLAPRDARSEHPADIAEARLADGRINRWFLDPLAGRGYPADVVEATAWNGTVIFPGDLETIAVATDMVGANYYTRQIAQSPSVADTERPSPIRVARSEITSMGWEVYPEGMYRVLEQLRDYGHQHIFVTESSAAYPDELVGGVVADEDRLDYHRRYLAQVGRAAADGVPVEGYFAWSLLDNFEWQFGYDMRFGLIRVDFESQRRTVKDSGRWYARVAEANGLTTTSL